MQMTEQEKKDAIQVIAYLMIEYYDKKDILEMYPRYAEIYDELYEDALAAAMDIVNRQGR